MQKIQLKKGLNIPFDIKNIHNPAKYFGRCKLNWLILAFVSLTSLIIVSCSSKEIHAPNGNLEINRRNITDYSYSSLYDIIAFDFNQYEILEYYNSDSMLELSSQKPYTYIMHKYMDLCLDFLAQQDLIDANPFEINRRVEPYAYDLHSKKNYLSSIILSLTDNYEYEDMSGTTFDDYFVILDEMLNAKLNTMGEVTSLIAEAMSISEQNEEPSDEEAFYNSSHIVIGGAAYHKLDVLLHKEDSIAFLHENEEDMQYVECDCGNNSRTAFGVKRIVRFNLFSLWPDGIIKYRNRNCPNINLMDSAMQEWVTAANNKIQFVEIQDNGWNRFMWSIGLSYHVCLNQTHNNNFNGGSTIAYVPWSTIVLNTTAGYPSYLHELGHTLGLIHEFQRCDRDNYVTIDWSNIKTGYAFNFVKLPEIIAHPYGSFDFNSIMMYLSLNYSDPFVLYPYTTSFLSS